MKKLALVMILSLPILAQATTLFDYAEQQITPIPPKKIMILRDLKDETERATSHSPVKVIPVISSKTVSLSPGSNIPLVRTTVNQTSNITFADSTGAAWPLAAPPVNANQNAFQMTYIKDANVVTIQALQPYQQSNITVYLQGLAVPVVVDLTSGDPDSQANTLTIDARIDLRLPMRSKFSKATVPDGKISLYDKVLQGFLDGVPPKSARQLVIDNMDNTQAYQLGDTLYIRTRYRLRDEFDKTLSSPDGMHVYELPVTPIVNFSVMGRTQTVNMNIN